MAQLLSVTTPNEDDVNDLEVTVLLDSHPDVGTIFWTAAAPPDFRASFSGSGLPFANESQALYMTPNRGVAKASFDRIITIRMRTPGSYYVSNGTVLVPPTLHIVYYVNEQRVTSALQVSRGVPYRSLTYPKQRADAMFYSPENKTARSQEAILRESAYPSMNIEAPDFWGGKPPR